MAFFGMVEEPKIEQFEPFGILPAGAAPQAPRGIMDYLRDPYVRAALSGASRGFANAAQSGVRGTGYALAQGLSGAAEGATSWEEEQAKRAAERVNQLAADRRGVTDYRYRLNLVAQRIAKEKGIPIEEAEIEAEQIMSSAPVEGRKELAGIQYQNAAALEALRDKARRGQMITEADIRMATEPQVAAAVEEAKTQVQKGAAAQESARSTDTTIDVIEKIKTLVPESYVGGGVNAIARVATSVGAAPDDRKAQNTAQIEALSTQLKFMAKPPGLGTMTDSEWKIITSAIGDPTTGDKGTYMAALDALKYALEGRMPPESVRQAYGGGNRSAQSGGVKRIRIDAQGNIR